MLSFLGTDSSARTQGPNTSQSIINSFELFQYTPDFLLEKANNSVSKMDLSPLHTNILSKVLDAVQVFSKHLCWYTTEGTLKSCFIRSDELSSVSSVSSSFSISIPSSFSF